MTLFSLLPFTYTPRTPLSPRLPNEGDCNGCRPPSPPVSPPPPPTAQTPTPPYQPPKLWLQSLCNLGPAVPAIRRKNSPRVQRLLLSLSFPLVLVQSLPQLTCCQAAVIKDTKLLRPESQAERWKIKIDVTKGIFLFFFFFFFHYHLICRETSER